MKLNIYLIGAFFGMFILSSCSNDDDEIPVPYSKDNSNWGYFKGTINGKEISLKNERSYDLPVWTLTKHIISYYPPEELDKPDSIRKKRTVIGMSTGIKYSEDESMGVNIFDLYMGVRYITHSTGADLIYDKIQISRDTHSNEYEKKYIRYIPQKENPFRAEITNIEYADDTHPILEVKLDGVLYRSDNPKDSIIVKGSYGTR